MLRCECDRNAKWWHQYFYANASTQVSIWHFEGHNYRVASSENAIYLQCPNVSYLIKVIENCSYVSRALLLLCNHKHFWNVYSIYNKTIFFFHQIAFMIIASLSNRKGGLRKSSSDSIYTMKHCLFPATFNIEAWIRHFYQNYYRE